MTGCVDNWSLCTALRDLFIQKNWVVYVCNIQYKPRTLVAIVIAMNVPWRHVGLGVDEVGERQFRKRALCLCDAKTLNPPARSPAPSGKTASLPLEFRRTRRQTCGGSYIASVEGAARYADKGGIIGVSTEWTTGHKFRRGGSRRPNKNYKRGKSTGDGKI